jgi:glycogen debranching enzyme
MHPLRAAALALVIVAPSAGAEDFRPSTALPSPIQLEGPARRGAYVESAGRRAVILGSEDGNFEVWVYPMKIVHDLRLSFVLGSDPRPIRGADVATRVVVRPEWTTIVHVHPAFTARETIFAPTDEPGVIVDVEVDASEPVTVLASFQPDLKPMWPAGLGGQFCAFDAAKKRFTISESLRRYVAYLGSPQASRATDAPAHMLPDSPTEMSMDLAPTAGSPARATIAIAASTRGTGEAEAAWQRLLSARSDLYRSAIEHATALHDGWLSIRTPEDEIDLALEWSKVALDRGLVTNPDLGTGLVAGLGPSGTSARPGFGWFFGGDASWNALSLDALGAFDVTRTALGFCADRQRDDGKIPHEWTQSAAMIRWAEEYPYAYYHADTTAQWIVAVGDWWRSTGDSRGLAELWPAVRKAYDFIRRADTDGDGILENTAAGYGAMELGALLPESFEDVFLAGLSAEAHRVVAELAKAVGDEGLRAVAEAQADVARTAINERFWDPTARTVAFAIGKKSERIVEPTPWPAVPIAFGWVDDDKANATLDRIAASDLRTDWGTRVVANTSRLYSPLHYNQGTVWPFMGGYPALAEFRLRRPWAAYDLLRSSARLTFLFARGMEGEVFSGDRCAPTGEAVPHQLFSTGAFVAPLVRGMLGISVDAPKKRVRFAPQIPAFWPGVSVQRVRVGGGTVDLEYRREPTRLHLEATPRGTPGARLVFDPVLDPGAEPVRSTLPLEVSLDAPVKVDVELLAGTRIDAEPILPVAGEPSRGIRVLRAWRDSAGLHVLVDGPAAATRKLRVQGPTDVSPREISIVLEGAPGAPVRKEIVIPPPAAGEK